MDFGEGFVDSGNIKKYCFCAVVIKDCGEGFRDNGILKILFQ